MAESTAFKDVQRAFAAHSRDPDNHPAPADVEDRRMAIYRDLFFANISSLLGGTFPVLRKILDDETWDGLIRGFMRDYQSHTPYFLQLPGEFRNYLETAEPLPVDLPPFAQELAHYEWAELALKVSDQEPDLDRVRADGDLRAGVPVMSPLAWPLSYRYPVHQIRPDFQPDAPGETPTFLVVYRNLKDKVGFMEINPVTARLLELLQSESAASGEEVLRQVAQDIQHPEPEQVITAGLGILNDLREHDIILGCVR